MHVEANCSAALLKRDLLRCLILARVGYVLVELPVKIIVGAPLRLDRFQDALRWKALRQSNTGMADSVLPPACAVRCRCARTCKTSKAWRIPERCRGR
jgi:hypothetical protein